MAIRNNYVRTISHDGKYEMSMDEFKKWLKRFDTDKDGRISKEELREAIRAGGVWFSRFRCRKGFKVADKNANGFIDDNEIKFLTDFALKHFGVRIVTY
ncbi:hypothetical protein M9H77_24999 [Catharanthus roseus]|uniref:Uncharacterized protein n=1 Tax=Catharanthus roseus TaxID=4058 RepID=A0ACC0A9N8_CATRO|nr:hypothetical protein M9H77_24999 [Catharanthus roseus]